MFPHHDGTVRECLREPPADVARWCGLASGSTASRLILGILPRHGLLCGHKHISLIQRGRGIRPGDAPATQIKRSQLRDRRSIGCHVRPAVAGKMRKAPRDPRTSSAADQAAPHRLFARPLHRLSALTAPRLARICPFADPKSGPTTAASTDDAAKE